MLKIRPANKRDVKALSRLNLDFNGVLIGEEQIKKSLDDNEDETVLVAEINEELVGFSCIRIFKSFCYESSTAEITDIFVSEDFRGNGIASQLMNSLLDIAKEKCGDVFLRTHSTNQAGNRFFNKFFQEVDHKVYRKRFVQ